MADKKLRVGIVFGGRSGEHEVSLASAASVIVAIDRSRFDALPIGIAPDGRWLVGGDPLRALGEEASRRALGTGGAEAQTKRELLERAAAIETGAALARMESSESLPPGLRNRLDRFTTTSAYPRLWEASCIPYPELIARLIDLALERRR